MGRKNNTINYQIGQQNIMEKNDCIVRALANALDKPYHEAWESLAAMGRRSYHKTPLHICFAAVLGWGMGLASSVRRRGVSHARFLATHPKGRFVVMSATHAWAIKDGVVFDSWCPGPRKRILWIAYV